MGKLLDFIHRHKKAVGALLAAGAAAATYLGEHGVADVILYVGTLLGTGFLPNGPNPKE